MNKTTFFTLALFALLCSVFSGCKKDANREDLLTKGFWKVDDITFDNVVGTPFGGDLAGELEDYSNCARSVELSCEDNGDWTYGGGEDCIFEDAYNSLGAWSFSPSQDNLTLDNGSFTEDWEIISISGNTLKVKFYDCTSCGGQYSVSFYVTLILKHG